ncbi:SDR family NAD(P)-dependent oxidoreductase [Microvirga pakistanensis]|uniref:SDR family NAD(P)-dependent oxidoreductase n=1 Tax=Microvirga pakistanensis TaxID=1682650 RepID=UPI00195E2F15|nr:SDR family NAD(P)-dependent oxidoreductase [Microvirga pakistanensis]
MAHPMFNFAGKTLLLTGANGSISRAIAKLFFDLGASCALTDIDEAALQAFARELDPQAERTLVLSQDAASSADADRALAAAKGRFETIDFVVTSAGLYRDQMVHDMTDQQWQQSLDINLSGVFYTCRAAIPYLSDGASIVNIASMAGHKGSYMHSHYAAAKGGVLTFSRSLALELAPRVRVNAVSPGLIDGPMVQPLLRLRGPQLIEQTPLKRLGQPAEVARLVAFLCSDWASFITGESVHVNGGLYIGS